MLSTPARNLIQAIRFGANPNSFQNANLAWGMPLPAASGQNEFNSQPAMSEVTTITARLIPANRAKLPVAWSA